MKLYKDDRLMSFMQRGVDSIMDQYIPYATYERMFSLQSLKDELGESYKSAPLITEDMLRIFLEYAVAHNFGYKKELR
jgi:hypothetical protein